VITSPSVSAEARADCVSLKRMSMSSSKLATIEMRVRAPTLAPHRAVSRPLKDGTGGGIGRPSSRPRMMLGTLGSSGGSGRMAAQL
jgi:hypothetical protein